MGFEIDFLPVGAGEKSGDAIAVRFGDLSRNEPTVSVIDGGTQDSGEALVSHVRQHYGTNRVDFAILKVRCQYRRPLTCARNAGISTNQPARLILAAPRRTDR
jgi:hypothetical protein